MPESSGIGGLLGKSTAGLPNWAWLLVIAGGIAAAILVPKLFGGSSSTDTTSTDGSTTAPTDVLPPTIGGGIGDGTGGGGGVGIMPPVMPPSPVGPPLPDCSLEKSCAQPPVNGQCPPGMHLAKDGLCRCNAKGMVNWGTVCLPPGQVPPGYTTSTVTPPPTATQTAVAGQEASMASADDKLHQQEGLHPLPIVTHGGHKPPKGKPPTEQDSDTIAPFKRTPRWPNE